MKGATQQKYSVGKIRNRIIAVSRAREANLSSRVEIPASTGSVFAVSVRHFNRVCRRCMSIDHLVFLLLSQSINQSRYLQTKTSACQLVDYSCSHKPCVSSPRYWSTRKTVATSGEPKQRCPLKLAFCHCPRKTASCRKPRKRSTRAEIL